MRTTLGRLDAGRERWHLSIRGPIAQVDDFGILLASLLDDPMTIDRSPTGRSALMVSIGDASYGRFQKLVYARPGLSYARVATAPNGHPFLFSDIEHIDPVDIGDFGYVPTDSPEQGWAWYRCSDTNTMRLDTPGPTLYHNAFTGFVRRYYVTKRAGLTYVYLPYPAVNITHWIRRHGSSLRHVPGPPNDQQTPTFASQGPGEGHRPTTHPDADP